METTQVLSILGGIAAALIFIYILTRKDDKTGITQPPSIVKGFSCFFSDNDPEALSEMRSIALNGKGTPEIYLAIGFLYRKMGEYAKAAQVHEVLLGNKELDKEYKNYLTTELAKDYLLGGMPVRTMAVLKDLPGRDQNPDNLEILAKASFDIQNYDNALIYLEKYKKASGKDIYGFHAKCMIAKAIAADDENKTSKYIKSALQEYPDCRSARFIKAGLLMKEGMKEKAVEEYKSILSGNLPRDGKDMKTVSDAFIAAGEETELIKLLKELSKTSKNPFIQISLAEHYNAGGEKEKAEDSLNRYLSRIGGNPAAVKYLASLTENKALLNILGNREIFRCRICKTDYNEYKDDCRVCGSFDSIYPK